MVVKERCFINIKYITVFLSMLEIKFLLFNYNVNEHSYYVIGT